MGSQNPYINMPRAASTTQTAESNMNPAQNASNFQGPYIPYNPTTENCLDDRSGNSYGYLVFETYIVLYDYKKRSEGELSIKEGDVVELFDKVDFDWWFVCNIATKETGYVPPNYIAKRDSLDSQPWYFGGIDRTEACRYLMLSSNEIGSFLVRDSVSENKSNDTTPYSLSVRLGKNVKHYRISKRGNAWCLTCVPNILLNSVEELIDFFKYNSGLCCTLGDPCIRPEKPATMGLSHSDKWELEKSAVKLKKKIGSGKFGDVYAGEVSNVKVAIKTLKKGTMKPECFLREATIMKQLQHKNLIQLYAVCTKEEPIYIITEFMTHGDLLNYLREGEGNTLFENILINMSIQIGKGMSYLEEKNFIHRDLAARNVLVGENNMVKVADFGLARIIEGSEHYASKGGQIPVRWTAPEALAHMRFTIKSDVWSFGILIHEIISRGGTPYEELSNRDILNYLDAGYRMPKDYECSTKLYNIMLKCWDQDPDRRPTFKQLALELEDYHANVNEPQINDRDVTYMQQRRVAPNNTTQSDQLCCCPLQ
ncbi:unnamed protein product [Meganyctiphanes norvegica]|uniref:Tyrosine-protein kinase n=1 Tax=Meganyctiphanes norvegica TaxID=48144 RepID=A0AAV2RNW1_MEGNR